MQPLTTSKPPSCRSEYGKPTQISPSSVTHSFGLTSALWSGFRRPSESWPVAGFSAVSAHFWGRLCPSTAKVSGASRESETPEKRRKSGGKSGVKIGSLSSIIWKPTAPADQRQRIFLFLFATFLHVQLCVATNWCGYVRQSICHKHVSLDATRPRSQKLLF